MKKVILGAATILLLITAAGFTAFAGTEGDRGPAGRPNMMERMHKPGKGMMAQRHRLLKELGELNLTGSQKEAIHGIGSSAMKAAVKKGADLKIARIELRDMLRRDPVEMASAEAKLRDIAALQTDLRLDRIRTWEEIKAQLTPEQRKQLMAKMKGHRHIGMRGRHRGGHQGMGLYPMMDEGMSEG